MADESDWQCSVCLKWYPVPVLAKDCLRRHDEDTAPVSH